tara:strand:+ start:955 stop:1707 length:753 start_codon:yes stop_codon:yes gene_type:complete
MKDYTEIVKKLTNDNFVIIKKFFTQDILKEIKNEIKKIEKMNLNKRDKHYVYNIKKQKVLSSIHNIHLYSDYYKNLIKKCQLKDIISERYGSASKRIFNASLFAKPKTHGLQTKIHQDNAFFNLEKGEALTCWVALDASNKKNGSLFYYKGSSALGLQKHIPEGNLGASMTIEQDTKFLKKIKKYKKIYIDIKPGDCVIHDALVIHGSDNNTSSTNRRAINFSISSLDKVDKIKLQQYKNKLKRFLNKKK